MSDEFDAAAWVDEALLAEDVSEPGWQQRAVAAAEAPVLPDDAEDDCGS